MRRPRLRRILVLAGIHLGVVLASTAAPFAMGSSRFDDCMYPASMVERRVDGLSRGLSYPGTWIWRALPLQLAAEWPFILLNSLTWALALDFGWKVVYWFRSHAKGASPEFPASSD